MGYTNFPNGLTSFGIPLPSDPLYSPFGRVWFVNTVTGSDGNKGRSPDDAFSTMAKALSVVGDNDTIMFIGKVREQLVAPLGVQGVKIVGANGGNNRNDDGAWWTTPASGAVAGQALIEIREQGWEFHHFMMTPDATGGACIKAHRNEDATYPDSSHFICNNMRFTGSGNSVTGTPIGIQDVGGNHHYIINNCEFQVLSKAIYCSSTSIATPLRNTVTNNKFLNNTVDIDSPSSYSLFQGNRHFSSGATTIIDIAAGEYNMVTGNVFPDAAADIDPAHGYDGNSTDTWTGNLVSDQAAFVYGDPA